MVLLKRTSTLAFIFLFGITALFAQQQQPAQTTEVSDAELEQFASALTEIQSIDQQMQQKMVAAVQDESIELEKFNEILTAEQDPGQEADASEDEREKFASAVKSVEQIQMKGQEEMQTVITDNELTVPRYQEIMMAVQSDAELQQKIQEHLEE